MPANIGGLLTAGKGDKGLRRRFADWGKTNLERLWIIPTKASLMSPAQFWLKLMIQRLDKAGTAHPELL